MNNQIISETVEAIFDKVYPNQINLKSFDEKKELNPKIWSKSLYLKKLIRKCLLNIAEDFLNDFEMNIVPEDIVVVGSIAGYNWSKYSDIDLHMIVDFNALSLYGTPETLKQLFDMKKDDWNSKHNILIYGYPVELYVQDINEENVSDGIYSVKNNRWEKVPQGGNELTDRELIKTQASQYINIIDKIEELSNTANTRRKLQILKDEVKKLKDEISQNRKLGLAESGEYNPMNIVFKVLRRSGYLGKLRELKVFLSDKIQSI